MTMELVTASEFARRIGVSKQGVSKAISVGRLPVYGPAGERVDAAAPRKFLKFSEAQAAFATSRARIDDAMVADIATAAPPPGDDDSNLPPSLLEAKANRERLSGELLEMRLARERGELISRAAQIDAFEAAGRRVARTFNDLPRFAEDLYSLAHTADVAALRAWLQTKANELCAGLADALTGDAQGDDDANTGDPVSS